MPPDEHQRERMRAWVQAYSDCGAELPETLAMFADASLAEFDKRFPAPALPVPDQSAMGMAVAGTILAQTAELATLREKARLFDKLCEELPPGWKQNLRYWDAVASGKFILEWSAVTEHDIGWSVTFHILSVQKTLQFFSTAAEAVQAAIDAGALK